MQKNRCFLMLAITTLALSSCTLADILGPITDDSTIIPTSTTSKPEPGYLTSNNENLYKHYYASNTSVIPTSVSNPKLLVIPILFKDSLIDQSVVLDNINKAFNGDDIDTGWKSVKTYYHTVSYGKTLLDITISNWYNSNQLSSNYRKDDSKCSRTVELCKAALDNYFSSSGKTRKDFDADGDGYLDGVCFVYSCNYEKDSNLWAYTYWNNSNKANRSEPALSNFSWFSVEFMKTDTQGDVKIDAHTYIHEVGHMFGLEDLYDYNSANLAPAGDFSMQDLNIGSHDPYSINTLGWGSPYAPTSSETITINPFIDEGKFIILSPSTYASCFDEYFMIEFYAPDGINAQDVNYSYEKKRNKGPNIFGIRFWHVDARLVKKASNNEYKEENITNKIKDDDSLYRLVCTNTSYTRGSRDDTTYITPLFYLNNHYENYRLLELIRRNDFAHEKLKDSVASSDLFIEGDTINLQDYLSYFVEGKCNSKVDFGWTSIKIDNISASKRTATITVTK